MWLKTLFQELGFPCATVPIVWSDNLAGKSISKNPVFYSQTKYIEIDVHFVREKVENGEVEVWYVPAANQVADVLTKGLPRDWFKFLRTRLGLILSPIQCGSTVVERFSTLDHSTSMESDLRESVGVV